MPVMRDTATAAVDLYWIPLGAGGHSVRFNGRVFEAIDAAREHRQRCDLYHAALVVELDDERYTIEVAPSPNADEASRGVVGTGAVGSRHAGRLRLFRYEIRCWQGGSIPDLAAAVGGPCRVSSDPQIARRLLDLVPLVPRPVWGRDELGAGEMWNSNSVIAWLIAATALPAELPRPPARGRAPGWDAGIEVARRNDTGNYGGTGEVDTDARRTASAESLLVQRIEEQPAMRKMFNLTTVASGAAIGMIIAGVLALVGGAYAKDVVHDQLAPQKIYFAEDASTLPPSLKQYAGQQVDTAGEAKLFAEDYIGLHLKDTAGGKTYSEVSGAWMQDQDNAELAQQRQTLFMGETLRGMLLQAWGWGTVGTIATIAGIALIGIGGVLLAIPLLSLLAGRRRVAAEHTASNSAPSPAG